MRVNKCLFCEIIQGNFGVNLGGKCKYHISYDPPSFELKTYLVFAFTTQIDPI